MRSSEIKNLGVAKHFYEYKGTIRERVKMAKNPNHDLFKQVPQPTQVDDYFHVFNKSNALNVLYWNSFFEMIEQIEGDIVECGVGRGRSLITILSLLELHAQKPGALERGVYALDSFCGFPEPTQNDKSARNPQKGEWAKSPNGQFSYSPENLEKILVKANISERQISNLKVLEGFFQNTIHHVQTDSIAILHLDGDLYESVKVPLINLEKNIACGGIIVLDDFTLEKEENEAFPGSRLATLEFLEEHPHYTMHESIRGTPYLLKESKSVQ